MNAYPSLFLTQSSAFRKARLTNQTSSSFVDKLPTLTMPAGDANTGTGAAVIDLNLSDPNEMKAGAAGVQNLALIMPFGVGSDTNTFSMRVIGWRLFPSSNPGPTNWVWVPVVLLEVLCTITSSFPGPGGDLGTTQYFAGTIAVVGTTGNTQSYEIVSPAQTKVAGHIVVDLKGFQKLELSFSTGSSATSCNALISMY